MSSHNQNEIPKSRKSYLFKMAAKMAVQQGKKYLNSHPDSKLKLLLSQADTLVRHVGRLKGAAMKAVQTLSIEGQDFLPPEVIEVLEKLQSQSEPIANEVVLELLEQELGPEKMSELRELDEKPIAAASIGQVYQAQYQQQDVVIKVQYPGVAESVDEDIDALKKILNLFLVVLQKRIDINDLMEEVRRVLKFETDYKRELESLERYKKMFEGSDYIIPKVYPELSTSKVLTMSKQEGLEFSQWLKTKPSQERRNKIALQLLNLYVKEFFENKFVQTDPNPANFLINQQDQLVLLDFGATIDFDDTFVKHYQELIRTVFSKNRQAIKEQVLKLGFIKDKEEPQVQDAFVDFLLLSLAPFEDSRQPFDFANDDYSSEVRTKALSFSRQLKHSAPPKQLIFLHRKLGGIFMLLKKMEVQMDLSEFKKLIM